MQATSLCPLGLLCTFHDANIQRNKQTIMTKKTLQFNQLILILSLFTISTHAQELPQWFTDNMEASVGEWVTSNEQYKSDQEPFDQYGMKWEWGIGRKSIKGTLYGIVSGQPSAPFWEFRQYWDPQTQQGYVMQFGGNGMVGKGPIVMKADPHTTEMLQTYFQPDGTPSQHGHTAVLKEGKLNITSYHIDDDGSWRVNRNYVWQKK